MPPTTAPTGAVYVPASAPLMPSTAARWGRRLGVAATLFFLIKGLAWLLVPVAVAAFAAR